MIAFKNLVVRNRINERYHRQRQAQQRLESTAAIQQTQQTDVVAVAAVVEQQPSLEESMASLNPHHRIDRIHLPFLIVSTNRKAVIDCNISNDKYASFRS